MICPNSRVAFQNIITSTVGQKRRKSHRIPRADAALVWPWAQNSSRKTWSPSSAASSVPFMPTETGGTTQNILLAALFTPRHKQLKQNHNEKRINKEKKSLPFIWLEKFSFSCINLSEWGTAKESPDNVLFSRKFTFSSYWMEFERMNLKLGGGGWGKARALYP